MSRRRNSKRAGSDHTNIIELTQALVMNGRAVEEGPRRKTWTRHDLRNIRPLTPTQEDMFHAFFNGNNICAHGTAGTGKSFVALFLALTELLGRQTAERIIIVRSAVPSREVGFLPGTLEEKTAIYELPYIDIFRQLLGKSSSYNDMKEAGLVEFVTTSFIRGLTWDNAIIIVDEGQNMRFDEINTIMTRLGENSRIIFTGDLVQTDLRTKNSDVTGMADFLTVIKGMSEFSDISFNRHDIVRGPLVKSWICACEDAAIHP
jgi:phosphate starvation-inducible protein PhoH and related proteins